MNQSQAIVPTRFAFSNSHSSRHRWYRKFALSFLVKGLRNILQKGEIVVIIGQSGSGKTHIMEQVTPGNVLCNKAWMLTSNKWLRVQLSAEQIPACPFSLDEPQLWEPKSITHTLSKLPERGFMIAFQTLDEFRSFHSFNALLSSRQYTILTIKR